VTLTVDSSTVMGTDVISNTATVTGANETLINTGDDSATESTSVAGTTDVFLNGLSNLQIVDAAGTGTDDTLTLSRSGAAVRVYDPNNVLDAGNGAIQIDPHTVDVPLTNITGGTITIDTLGGDDSLSVDFAGGNFTTPVTLIEYLGGSQNTSPNGDTLTLAGGTFTEATLGFDNARDGSVTITGNALITYTGLEPITSSITATNVVLNYSGASETITVTDAGGGRTTITSTAGETTIFNNPSGTLTINTGGGDDIIDVTSLTPYYPAHVTINGQDGSDTVNVSAAVNPVMDKSLTVYADTIKVSGSSVISTSGAGSVTLKADRNIDINSGAMIETVNGDLTLEANLSGADTGSFVGMDVDGAMLMSTGGGSITMTAWGGDTSSDDGIAIDNTMVRVVDGTIQITGNAGHGTSSSDGVDIGTGSVIESIGFGSISIQGRSGSGSSSDGVEISDTTIQSVDGSIGIIGDASNADSSSDGVELDDSSITSQGGAIQITGNSMHAGSSADGVDINDSSIRSVTGHVQVMGTAVGAGSSADGIELANGTIIQTSDGPITIIGQGQLDGVYMTGTSTEISSVAGTITIDGTGGGISSAEGVHITGSLVKVTTSQGDIQITGTSGGDDDGVEIENGACVSSTGIGPNAGTITITGAGGSGTTDYGVALADASTLVTSVDGSINITGSSPGGDGVNIGGTAIVSSTGLGPNAAQIEINGTGGGVSSSEGLMITGVGTAVASIDGDIQIIGDSGGDDDGVEIHNGALVSSTGTGLDAATITVTGSGGIGSTDYGLELADMGTLITSVAGDITLHPVVMAFTSAVVLISRQRVWEPMRLRLPSRVWAAVPPVMKAFILPASIHGSVRLMGPSGSSEAVAVMMTVWKLRMGRRLPLPAPI